MNITDGFDNQEIFVEHQVNLFLLGSLVVMYCIIGNKLPSLIHNRTKLISYVLMELQLIWLIA